MKENGTEPNENIVVAGIVTLGKITRLFIETVYWVSKGILAFSFDMRLIFQQMARIGVDSLFIITITGFSTGAVLVAQTGSQFAQFGAESYVGGVVALSLARELAPVLTAIIIAGRIGGAIAAEIGSMQVTEQIDALRALATSPVNYLVVPRFLASIIMLPVLTVFTNVIGYLGGCMVAIYQVKINFLIYKESVIDFLKTDDIIGGLIKAAVFGVIISIIGCYKGFSTTGGAEGVGVSTTGSVVLAIILILVSNYFLSVFLFNLS